MEFKGTKGDWGFVFGDNKHEVFSEPIYTGDFKDICNNIDNEYDALLISKAPEMLQMLTHCMSLMEDASKYYKSTALNKAIKDTEQLIKQATEL